MQQKIPLTIKKEKSLNKVTKISANIWISCVMAVFAIFGYVVGIRKEMFDKAPNFFDFSLLGLILLGGMAFIIGVISFAAQIIVKRSQTKQNIFVFLIKFFFTLAILPLYLLIYILKPIRVFKKLRHDGIIGLLKSLHLKPVLSKVGALVLVGTVILPIWIGGYVAVGATVNEALGYGTELITVSGTGSMHPTFPKGEGKDPNELAKQIVGSPGMIRYPNGLLIGGKRYFGYQIGRGDIVVIENDIIREIAQNMYGRPSGWVKRIVGMPGDNIEIREGIVYLNGEPLKEPYTAQPHSTFGEAFLSECKTVIVPENSIFVMGDNRKGSGDSREIGFIEISAINHVLPIKNQAGVLDKGWRDTSKDFDKTSKIKLDTVKYLELLNEKRKEVGSKEIKYQPKLEVSASKRAEVILKFNDFSFEATQSGYTMGKAMRDANYSNIVSGETPIQGYYEAEELIDNQFQFPASKTFLTDKTYQEVGIAEVEGEINGCPTQVIVQHFAGYVPPNYKKENTESWKTSLSKLREVQSSWADLKNNPDYYQKYRGDVDRINEILLARIANLSAIASRMEANQWLTVAEQKMVDQDKTLYNEQETLANRLNSQQ